MKKIISIFLFLLPTLLLGQSIPLELKLENLQGQTVSLSQHLEKGPIFVAFWAIWCEPCKAELRTLRTLNTTYAEKGLTIVAVSIDNSKSISKVKSYIRSQKYEFPVLLDPESRLFELLNGKALPHAVLIDSEGKIAKIRTGFLPGDEKEIEKDFISVLESLKKK